jgi:transposase-like protein
MAATTGFFQFAKRVTGTRPAQVTTGGHDNYPRSIRIEFVEAAHHRTNQHLNNRIEQDHRGMKGRCQPMRVFKSISSAARFWRADDELRNFLRTRSNRNQHVPAAHRRLHFISRSRTAVSILKATSV